MRLVLITLILFAGFGIGGIFLQIFLSKKENKWLGLILPILTLCISLTAVLSMAAFNNEHKTTTRTIFQDGRVVEEITEDTVRKPSYAAGAGIIGAAALIFITYNIPTVVLLVIYAACRSGIKKNAELNKMNIQDL